MREYIIQSTAPEGRLVDSFNGIVKGELIRCRDCKYNYMKYEEYGPKKDWVYCTAHPGFFGVTPDNYCSMAERSEE